MKPCIWLFIVAKKSIFTDFQPLVFFFLLAFNLQDIRKGNYNRRDRWVSEAHCLLDKHMKGRANPSPFPALSFTDSKQVPFTAGLT